MNVLNEIKQILIPLDEFYGMVVTVESNRMYVTSPQGGQWYSVTGFAVGDRVFIRNGQVEKSSLVAEGDIFEV